MPAPIVRHASFLRVVRDADEITLRIDVGNGQLGEWRIRDASGVVDEGANQFPKVIPLGTGSQRKNKLVSVEVICEDHQPTNDYLNAVVEVGGIEVPVMWSPNNEGEESPQCIMNCTCDLYFV